MYLLIVQYSKIRQEELERMIKAIQLRRLGRMDQKSVPPWRRRMLVRLGRWFMALGAFLEKRYGFSVPSSNLFE